MIERTVEELTPIIGTRPACRAVGASVATIYRRRRPPEPGPPRPRPAPDRALSEPERAAVLEVLHSQRFVDVSPDETYATLLDEGTYLCSTRTMYRILAAHHGGVRERRNQLTPKSFGSSPANIVPGFSLRSLGAAGVAGGAERIHYRRR
jgi:putative transposase